MGDMKTGKTGRTWLTSATTHRIRRHGDRRDGVRLHHRLHLGGVAVLHNRCRDQKVRQLHLRRLVTVEQQLAHLGRRPVRPKHVVGLVRRSVVEPQPYRARVAVLRELGQLLAPLDDPRLVQVCRQEGAEPLAGHPPGARDFALEEQLACLAVVRGEALGFLVEFKVGVAQPLRQPLHEVLGQELLEERHRPVDKDCPVAGAVRHVQSPLENYHVEAILVPPSALRRSHMSDRRHKHTFLSPCAASSPVRPAPIMATFGALVPFGVVMVGIDTNFFLWLAEPSVSI